MEADQRHAEPIVKQLQLKAGKGVSTPGIDDKDDHEGDALEALGPQEATTLRGMVGRCIYLSADRPDIVFPVKELCPEMSKPTLRSIMRLKRVGRHLRTHPRLVGTFPWQAPVETIAVHTDANLAGCKASR